VVVTEKPRMEKLTQWIDEKAEGCECLTISRCRLSTAFAESHSRRNV